MPEEDIFEKLEKYIPRYIDRAAPKIIKWYVAWIFIKFTVAMIFLFIGAIISLMLYASIPPVKIVVQPTP